jgi:uncharacterized protein (TIGR02271 family)
MSKRDVSSGSRAKNQAGMSAVTMPVLAEAVTVQTRRSERGRVRLTKTVKEEQITIDPQAVRREISIERVPIDRFVDRPEGMRQEGDTLIIPVFEEVPVVIMKTKLKEEVRVTTRTISARRRTPVTVRRERLTVDRLPVNSQQVTPDDKGRKPK